MPMTPERRNEVAFKILAYGMRDNGEMSTYLRVKREIIAREKKYQ